MKKIKKFIKTHKEDIKTVALGFTPAVIAGCSVVAFGYGVRIGYETGVKAERSGMVDKDWVKD